MNPAALSSEKVCRRLKALSHPIRLGILNVLRSGEKNVFQLEALMGTTQSNISQHLAQLRDKDILTTRKQANQVFYSVADPRTFNLLDLLQELYGRL